MLSRARETLGESADLQLADAQSLPYPNASFNLIAATFVLHELTPDARTQVDREMLRVLAPDGSMQLVEFNVGPLRGVKGRLMRGVSDIAELMARRLHRSRAILAGGRVPALADQLGLEVQSRPR